MLNIRHIYKSESSSHVCLEKTQMVGVLNGIYVCAIQLNNEVSINSVRPSVDNRWEEFKFSSY